MRFKLLGKSGLRVSELCLGTMTFGPEWGWGASKEECRKMFDVFRAADGNFIDTANRYTEGTSEKIVGDLIADCRDQIVLATKYTLYMRRGDPNSAGNHRKNLVQSLEASLKRLKTDYLDLYWVHAYDYVTPIEETMRALDDLVRAGKVLHIGISDTPAWVVAQANTLAHERGWTQFCALQVEYSLIERTVERELLPMARAFGMSVTPWGVIGGGILSGKYRDRKAATYRYKDDADVERLSERSLRIGDEVVTIAGEIGCKPAQVAINWVRQQWAHMIPIVGARTAEQLRANLACLERPVPQQYVDRLNRISAIELGFPHDFLSNESIRNLVSGGTWDKLDTNS